MDNWYVFLTTSFLGFFAMLNPIGNTTVFLNMTKGADKMVIRKVAFRTVLVAFIIIAVFCFFGHIIFKLFGITQPAFQIAGGIIVFFIGYDLMQGKEASIHNISEESSVKTLMNKAISPLAIPLLAGPGTISTAMNFVGEGNSILHTTMVIVVFAVVCALTFFLFIMSKWISEKVNPSLINVVTRIMGLILAVIAVQMLITGVMTLIHNYPSM